MKTQRAIDFYGGEPYGRAKMAKALGIRPQSTYRWSEIVPELRARQLVEITGGALAFVASDYKKDDR